MLSGDRLMLSEEIGELLAEEIGELNVVVRRCRLEKEEKAWLLMRSEMATETFCIESLEAAGSLVGSCPTRCKEAT